MYIYLHILTDFFSFFCIIKFQRVIISLFHDILFLYFHFSRTELRWNWFLMYCHGHIYDEFTATRIPIDPSIDNNKLMSVH